VYAVQIWTRERISDQMQAVHDQQNLEAAGINADAKLAVPASGATLVYGYPAS